ncbi:glycosyltransferase family 2 protein [Polynucleobacter paneuropaeus]|nr:glycosyltransferase family 2 protein [Polynucleobacter paneuropaeus]MBT8587031.1 glycosyltransferase family 2 protein [Polynucleobacter paneuropaeus]MBT8599699.1 glycosyltransferase family 2 protein [Polynucleobacter paneuropaeus]
MNTLDSVNKTLESMPKVSVITVNKNGGKFLRETLDSVKAQNFKNYEHIVIDSASTDNSLEILEEYPDVRWISEVDSSPNEGFRKGFVMANGEYIMIMCVSDKYLSNTWFQRCVETLDSDNEVSLVWGLSVDMNEVGDINAVWSPWWFHTTPPQKKKFFDFWIATAAYLPELNYCVRKTVYLECFPDEIEGDLMSTYNPFLLMVFNFMRKGYQPYFLRIIAHCGRVHEGQITQTRADLEVKTRRAYKHLVFRYAINIFLGRSKHQFRSGSGEINGTLDLWHRLVLPVSILLNRAKLLALKTINLAPLKRLLDLISK